MGIEKESINIEDLLKSSGIRPSPARILVLKAIYYSDKPLSAQEIENRIDTLDRSSITRTLPVLVECRLIHQISDGSGSMKYESCHDLENDSRHSDCHAHFHCRHCGETICFPDMEISLPEVPDGYEIENLTYIITGICPKCNR